LLPGSLITLRRRCGTAGCRCARGELHETPALSYSVAGRTKMLTLRAEDVDAVAEAVARYRVALRELETEARDELAALMACVAARRGTGRERGPPGGFAGSAELFTAIVRFPAGPQAGTLSTANWRSALPSTAATCCASCRRTTSTCVPPRRPASPRWSTPTASPDDVTPAEPHPCHFQPPLNSFTVKDPLIAASGKTAVWHIGAGVYFRCRVMS
jgi:hypothetical protein